jgi:hypothetical protein
LHTISQNHHKQLGYIEVYDYWPREGEEPHPPTGQPYEGRQEYGLRTPGYDPLKRHHGHYIYPGTPEDVKQEYYKHHQHHHEEHHEEHHHAGEHHHGEKQH